MTRIEKIKKYFENNTDWYKEVDTGSLVDLHNAICEKLGYEDDIMYMMCDFEEIVCVESKMRLLFMAFNGHHFNPNDCYFWFNGYENLESCDEYDSRHALDKILWYLDDESEMIYDYLVTNCNFDEIEDDEEESEG